MNSPHQREQLPDLLSDALTSSERARVESHLATCEQCARELRALQQMQQTLAALTPATPPERVRANVRAALRQNQKQAWALPSLWPKRAGKTLPFALPARQLAWGGAVALSAAGLMLLARPSLHNDTFSQSAPVSETQMAERATSSGSANALGGATKTAKKPGVAPKATRNAKSALPSEAVNSTKGTAPELPPLPPPRTRVAPAPNMAPPPAIEMPSLDATPDVAPIPAPKSNGGKPENRAGVPAAPKKSDQAVPHKPNSPARTATPDQAPMQKPNIQSEASGAQAPALPSTPGAVPDAARAKSRADSSQAPVADAPGARSDNAPAAFSPHSRINSAAPAPAAPAPQQKSDVTGDWPGGAVEASINAASPAMSRAGMMKTAPVLTLRVALAIGNARLLLLLPNGETQVWRGSLNAAPVEIPLGKVASQVVSGQKIRARLEQIDDEGNPKSSTTFTVLWP